MNFINIFFKSVKTKKLGYKFFSNIPPINNEKKKYPYKRIPLNKKIENLKKKIDILSLKDEIIQLESEISEDFSFEDFSTKCTTLGKNIKELTEIFDNNLDLIKESIKNTKSLNYLTFVMQTFLDMNFQKSEIFNLVLKKLIGYRLNDPDQLNLLYLSIENYTGNSTFFDDFIKYLQEQIILTKSLFKRKDLIIIHGITNLNERFKNVDFLKKLKAEANLTEQERNKNFLEQIGLKGIEISDKSKLTLTKIDLELNEFRLINKETNQELIFYGCENHPNENLSYVIPMIKSVKPDLLILEDYPIDEEINEKAIKPEKTVLKQAISQIKQLAFREKMYDSDLEIYIKTFINNEMFVYNPKQEVIFQKINPSVFIPSELGTITLHYILNSEIKPKLFLADFPLNFKMYDLLNNKTLNNLKDLMNIVSLVNLLEKTRYAYYCKNYGCSRCGYTKTLPRDYFSILAGDNLIELDEKIHYFARKIFEILENNTENKKILIVHGSFHFRALFQEIMKISILKQNGNFDNINITEKKKKDIINSLSKITNQDEFLEKSAIVEVLYQSFNSKASTEIENKDKKLDFAKYLDFIHKYEELLSYESLAGIEYKNIPRGFGDCHSDSLIFGGKEGIIEELRARKFWLNPAFQQHFSGNDEEIEILRKLFIQLREKSRGTKIELIENVEEIKESKRKKKKPITMKKKIKTDEIKL